MEIVDYDSRSALQKRKTRRNCWTQAMRVGFLDHLAATCNVRHAALAIERSAGAAYFQRRNDPVFAAAWDAAMAEGYDRLEAELLALAMGTGSGAPIDFDAERAGIAIDPELALKMLSRHGTDRPSTLRAARGGVCKRVPIDEVEAVLLRQLAVFEKRMRRRA